MSRSGILLVWSTDRLIAQLPRPGELMTVDIELPANHAFGRRCMHCQTMVARVSTAEPGGPRVALQVTQMQFRSYSNGRPATSATHDEFSCLLM